MNIWAWVDKTQEQLRESGNARLAELMDLLPEYATESQHANLDAIYPEALALAKATRNPWIEIFVRHWNMQSRVLVRCEAKSSLEEAVSLAEFSSREEHQACPQSVCVTQDLTTCYASFDGPGYAQERQAACQETLDRIDASWPCFVCIASEHSDALVDGGQPEVALSYLQARELELRSRQPDEVPRLSRKRFDPLYALGRFEEAQKCAEEGIEHAEDGNAEARCRIQKAAAMAAQGLLEQAWEELPGWPQVGPTPSRYQYYDAALLAIGLKADASLQAEISRRLAIMDRTYERQGCHRFGFELALRRTRLCLAMGHKVLARACWERARTLSERLVSPLGAPAALEALEKEWEALNSQPELPESPQEVALDLPDPGDQLELLEAAARRWPDHDWGLAEAEAWRRADWPEKAYQLLDRERHPMELAFWFLCDGRLEEFDRLLAELLASDLTVDERSRLLFFRAQSERDRQQWSASIETLKEILTLQPDARNTRYLLSESYRRVGEYEPALELLAHLCATEEPGNRDWDRMVVATRLGRWDQVRDSAQRLGMELSSEDGPIDESWGMVRIQLEEADGRCFRWFSVRTGPVTARVVQMSHRGLETIRYGDEVLFEPTPLDKDSDDDSMVSYPGLEILKAGEYRIFPIDGVDPGAEKLGALGESFPPGLVLRSHTNDAYRVREGKLPGYFGSLAVPPSLTPKQTHDLLHSLTENWEHPLLWPSLAMAADLPEEAARQQEVAQTYEIECG